MPNRSAAAVGMQAAVGYLSVRAAEGMQEMEAIAAAVVHQLEDGAGVALIGRAEKVAVTVRDQAPR